MTDYSERDHPLVQHLSSLLATRARRRMAVVAACSLLFSLFSAGFETLMPLWVTQQLGFSAADWANLRSLRFYGVFAGVIVLGALCLLGAAGCLVGYWLNGRAVVWLLMPFYGSLMSTVFVNVNALTQGISDRRQGVANTIYRGVGAGAGILAPTAATGLVAYWGGYPPVFALCAALSVAAGVVLLCYPGETTPPPLGNWRLEVSRLARGYLVGLRQRPMMGFIVISMLWGNVLSGVGAFFAVYVTLPAYHINMSNAAYGQLLSLTGILTLVATLAAGAMLDRLSLRWAHVVVGLLAGLCSVVMGLTNLLPAIKVAFVVFIIITNVLIGPSSMWVSRAAGEGTQTAAFTIHKVVAALTVAIAMGTLGYLESHGVSVRAIFLYGGVLGILCSFGYFLLPEPPPPSLGKPRARVAEPAEQGT